MTPTAPPPVVRVLIELNSSDLRIGAVNDALDLAQLTAPLGAQLTLCGPLTDALCEEAARRGANVLRAHSREFSRRGLPIYGLDVARWLVRLRRRRPDVVHLNYAGYGPALGCAAHMAGIPVVARAGPFVADNPANRWVGAYVANCRAHADDLLASPLADRVVVTGDLFRPERVRMTTTLERPLPPKTAGATRIVFLGQLVERKGLHVLVEAFARLRGRAELLLIGGDWRQPGYPQRIRDLARDLGVIDRIHFDGHRGDVGAVLKTADILVLPSLGEARPRVIIEAMSLGIPVVASHVGGIPSLVNHGAAGLLVPPADPVSLAAALDRLVESSSLRGSLGAAARRHVEQECRPDVTASEYVSLYRRLMRSGPQPVSRAIVAGARG